MPLSESLTSFESSNNVNESALFSYKCTMCSTFRPFLQRQSIFYVSRMCDLQKLRSYINVYFITRKICHEIIIHAQKESMILRMIPTSSSDNPSINNLQRSAIILMQRNCVDRRESPYTQRKENA